MRICPLLHLYVKFDSCDLCFFFSNKLSICLTYFWLSQSQIINRMYDLTLSLHSFFSCHRADTHVSVKPPFNIFFEPFMILYVTMVFFVLNLNSKLISELLRVKKLQSLIRNVFWLLYRDDDTKAPDSFIKRRFTSPKSGVISSFLEDCLSVDSDDPKLTVSLHSLFY